MTEPESTASADTVGALVDRAAAAAPRSISWRGWRLTYLGEVQLTTPADDTYSLPFPALPVSQEEPNP